MKTTVDVIAEKIVDFHQEESSKISHDEIEERFRAEEFKIKQVETDLKKEGLESSKQDREGRKGYANKLFIFLVLFISCVLIIVFLVGCEKIPFKLDNSILIALLTTTIANIISIFVFVVKYLFRTI
ncbi:MAG: hypothetical protein FWH18_06925 [Marinilabiliaceae bacterium]|nr:hypothetical protein [Marinilabiliaceae bacterium]